MAAASTSMFLPSLSSPLHDSLRNPDLSPSYVTTGTGSSRARFLARKKINARGSQHRFNVFSMHGSKATVVTGNTWEKSVLKSEVPVLVEFHASWCGPCRMVHRVIDEIASEYAGRLSCFILDTDDDLRVAEEYEIKAVPVVLLFKNGEKRECVVGTMPKDFYVAAIEKVLAS